MNVPQGLHVHRLHPDADNPREVALATEWVHLHQRSDLLRTLLTVPCGKGDDGAFLNHGEDYARQPLGEPTERDRIIAATVFQWVGSNCGLFSVTEALEKCGYSLGWKGKP